MKHLLLTYLPKKEKKNIMEKVFGTLIGDNLEPFFSNLDDNHKEIFLRSAHLLKFYIEELNKLDKNQKHIRDIYGFVGLIFLIEFCAQNDPDFKKRAYETAFVNYCKKGMTQNEKNNLVRKISIQKENATNSFNSKVTRRLKLIYSFRSNFVHNLQLPPVRREEVHFLGHFSILEKKRLYLIIRLSFNEYVNIFKRIILRNLGYRGLD